MEESGFVEDFSHREVEMQRKRRLWGWHGWIASLTHGCRYSQARWTLKDGTPWRAAVQLGHRVGTSSAVQWNRTWSCCDSCTAARLPVHMPSCGVSNMSTRASISFSNILSYISASSLWASSSFLWSCMVVKPVFSFSISPSGNVSQLWDDKQISCSQDAWESLQLPLASDSWLNVYSHSHTIMSNYETWLEWVLWQ